MIPMDYLQQWALTTPWPDSAQIEQDLIISRVLCDLFNEPRLAGKIAFRGGTAIHKLLFPKPLRYSEDIDLVQLQVGPIGPIVKSGRLALSSMVFVLRSIGWVRAKENQQPIRCI